MNKTRPEGLGKMNRDFMKMLIMGLMLLSSTSSFALELKGTVEGFRRNGNLEFQGDAYTYRATGSCMGGDLLPGTDEVDEIMKSIKPGDSVKFAGSQMGTGCNFFVRKIEVLK